MNRREARRAKRRARREARDECVDVLMAAVGYSCLTYVYLVAQISQIYYCKVRLGRLMAAVFCVLLAVPLVGRLRVLLAKAAKRNKTNYVGKPRLTAPRRPVRCAFFSNI